MKVRGICGIAKQEFCHYCVLNFYFLFFIYSLTSHLIDSIFKNIMAQIASYYPNFGPILVGVISDFLKVKSFSFCSRSNLLINSFAWT